MTANKTRTPTAVAGHGRWGGGEPGGQTSRFPVTGSEEGGSQSCVFGPIMVRFDERILAPRAWTLLQSRWAARLAKDAPPGPIVELFAGAGHIGLAAAVLAGRKLIQVEKDAVAAAYATLNAVHAGWADMTVVRHGPVQTSLDSHERFPIILADPPYIPSAAVDRWPGDPRWAIDGGPDGTALVQLGLRLAAQHLHAEGSLLLQVAGKHQAGVIGEMVGAQFPALHYGETRSHDDERAVMSFTKERETDVGCRDCARPQKSSSKATAPDTPIW